MTRPRFEIDFNELIALNLVLLSRSDDRLDSDGNSVVLIKGMEVAIWEVDFDEAGVRDDLIAEGVAVLNTRGGHSSHVKWCCLIDASGIRHQSDLKTNGAS